MSAIARNFILFAAMWLPFCATAQELSPRAHWPTPVGTRVATVGMSYVTGDAVPDRSLPITGVDSTISNVHFGYRQTVDWMGRTANITLELPFTSGETTGFQDTNVNLERDYDGVGDLAATFAINFLGAPAMNREQFAAFRAKPETILGGSLKLVAPTGTYNPNRLINVGANRWAMKAEVGYINALTRKWIVELSLGAWFFADNDEFLETKKEQQPIVAFQGHLIHQFSPGLWVSLDMNFYQGGRSTIGGVKLNDLQRDSKIGATLVYTFSKGKAVKVGYSNGSLNDSEEAFNVFLVSYQQAF